ncbi:hypothetical protein P153DRAFT_296927 [Dothidotthia symphoricarpi CBS 119687]|uniref:Uncharacterized protein n=1 Tax=Dothidotthia symphoricarpi CBS 119687 TaxID=1392245 RepID=A0A6A6A4W6_9PLEO|nr:uncharacterized protein P153DRAFT_296927 [Dothidotthia symphoricarpi CBS 119687]KAF2126850.1 hypothetical protein P153DRAFT_296927 [Dothidotthia symphoricarpi CBS 119687]
MKRSHMEDHIVTVQVCSRHTHNHEHVASISRSSLKQHAPDVVHLITQPSHTDNPRLQLHLPSLEHAHDIEIPALQKLFETWAQHSSYQILDEAALTFPTFSDSVLLYRALQLLRSPLAVGMQVQLLHRTRTEPLDEVDVQCVWWAFKHTPEWSVWLHALMGNIAGFDLLDKQPTGGYIRHFMETELLLLTTTERDDIHSMYKWHARLARRSTHHIPYWRRMFCWLFG